ncbi:MAG: hypothetical protein PWR10_402 [Halanaerobiales bacterium]|nr:hypothetical protein [Halanaerobiales bacterium]
MEKAKTTSWTVAAIGVAVAALGWSLLPSLWGAGILGFGIAHIILGLLDTQRPTVK